MSCVNSTGVGYYSSEFLVWKFVWGSRMELVKRASCLLPVLEGGLGMVDFGVRVRALRVVNVVSTLRCGEGQMW